LCLFSVFSVIEADVKLCLFILKINTT
jgi:hypothetical protein